MSIAIAREQYAAILDMHPKPSIAMFSSEQARTSWRNDRLILTFIVFLRSYGCCEISSRLNLLYSLGSFLGPSEDMSEFILLGAGGWIFRPICRDSNLLRQAYAARLFSASFQDHVSSVRRVCLQYDEVFIDGLELRLPNAKPDRWMLISNGNSDCLEYRTVLQGEKDWIFRIAEESQSNILIFNYPGVMKSQGNITRNNVVKSYQACVRYLRDEPAGPQARQIVAYGYSLGASVQAEALSKEIADGSDSVRWFVVKDRGARSTGAVAKQFIGSLGVWLANLTHWNINSEKRSKDLHCPELFIYGKDSQGNLIGDGLFKKETCFAAPFLDPKNLEECSGKKIPVAQTGLRHDHILSDDVIKEVAGHIQRHFDN